MFVSDCRSFEASHIPYCLCIQQAKQVKDLINFSVVECGLLVLQGVQANFLGHLVAEECTGFVALVVYVDKVNLVT